MERVKFKTIHSVFAFLLLLFANQCLANKVSVDAKKFDIAGVKLGMTSAVAIAAITAQLKLEGNELVTVSLPDAPSGDISYFRVYLDKASVKATFTKGNTFSKSGAGWVVGSVRYDMYAAHDDQKTQQEIKEMALTKYGHPSISMLGSHSQRFEWCLDPSHPLLGCNGFRGPVLVLENTWLGLGYSLGLK